MNYRILILGILILLGLSLPNVNALPPCLIQSINYNFPSSASVGQRITVTTRLQATCVQWPPYAVAYSIRVDLTDLNTFIVQSTTTYQLGYSQTYVDQVFVNTGTAPNSTGSWPLRVDVYLWGGSGQLLIHVTDYAKLPVQ